jgi:hypothetical protein
LGLDKIIFVLLRPAATKNSSAKKQVLARRLTQRLTQFLTQFFGSFESIGEAVTTSATGIIVFIGAVFRRAQARPRGANFHP